jgi:hypothetical protein
MPMPSALQSESTTMMMMPLPFKFYPEEDDSASTNQGYPCAKEKRHIRVVFGRPDWRADYEVYAAPPTITTTMLLRIMGPMVRYSRCILVLQRPPIMRHVITRHVLAHTCPEDLRSGIDALLARLGLDHWVRVTNQCSCFEPPNTWWMMNHSLPVFTPEHGKTIEERAAYRRDAYDLGFDSLLNRGKLTLLEIHLERSPWTIGRTDAAVQHALQRHARAW